MVMVTKIQSKLIIEEPKIPDGTYETNVCRRSTGESIFFDSLTYIDGRVELFVEESGGTDFMTALNSVGQEPEVGGLVPCKTIGTIEIYNNEIFLSSEDYIKNKYDIAEVNGIPYQLGVNVRLSSGAVVCFTGYGEMKYSPDNAFNTLNQGDAVTDQIPYRLQPVVTDIWTGTYDAIVTGIDWFDDGDGFFSVNAQSNPVSRVYPLALTTGATCVVTTDVVVSSVPNTPGGSEFTLGGDIAVKQLDSDGNVIGSNAFVISNGSGLAKEWTFVVAEGAVALEFNPANNTRMSLRVASLAQSTPAPVEYLEVTVLGSVDVGNELNVSKVWTGTNWIEQADVFEHTPGSTEPLEATFALEENCIYQIDVEAQDLTSGGFQVALGSNEHPFVYETNDGVAITLRANSDSEVLKITPTSDLVANIKKTISIRKIIKKGTDACDVDRLLVTPGTGQVNLEWMISPEKRMSQLYNAQFTYTGLDLVASDAQFGVRHNNEIESIYVHDATIYAKRHGVSCKGGQWGELYNVRVEGGFVEIEGVTGKEKFQAGVSFSDADPLMVHGHCIHFDVDLQLEPMGDTNYVLTNSDPIVANGAGQAANDARLYNFDARLTGSSDGIVDSKLPTFNNFLTAGTCHRSIRTHDKTAQLVVNSDLTEHPESQCIYHVAYGASRISVWNNYIDGLRVISRQQMLDLESKIGVHSDRAALLTDHPEENAYDGFTVLRTYPKLPPQIYARMTDLEFEYSTDNVNWSPLDVPNVDDKTFRGAFWRSAPLAPGTYYIQMRTRNHDSFGTRKLAETTVEVL